MKVLAKRSVSAKTMKEAEEIALASIHGEEKKLIQVQCVPQEEGIYRCFAGYKTLRRKS